MVYIRFDRFMRLGNWMFQYAAAKSIGRGGPVAFLLCAEDEKAMLEPFRMMFPDVTYVVGLANGAAEIQSYTRNLQECRSLADSQNVLLTGAFQDWRYFDDAIVDGLFAYPEEARRSNERRYGELLRRENLVSIHVRREDYLRLAHRHPFVGEQYLRSALRRFGEKHDYLVCSDDLKWCRRFFVSSVFPGYRFHFIEGGDCISDLYIPAHCRHNIISNSTFGWWGARLNRHRDRQVVMPGMWFGLAMSERHPNRLYWPGVTVVDNGYSPGLWLRAQGCRFRERLGKLLRRRDAM